MNPKYFFAIFILLLFVVDIFSQSPQQPQILIGITVTDGRSDIRNLKIGIDPNASDGIDDSLGEALLPPFPPLSVFEARFNLPANNFNGTESSYFDYRNGAVPYTGVKEHRLVFQKGEGDSVVIFWNFPSSVTAVLQDIITGTLINLSMSGEGDFVVPNPNAFNQLKLIVTYNNTTNIEQEKNNLPEGYILYQNYPNPFNPVTTIKYALNSNQYVQLRIYDVLGNELVKLVNEAQNAGTYEVRFNAENLAAGIYFYELNLSGNDYSSIKNSKQVKSMILLK